MKYWTIDICLTKDLHLAFEVAGDEGSLNAYVEQYFSKVISYVSIHRDQIRGGSIALLGVRRDPTVYLRTDAIVAVRVSDGYDEPISHYWRNVAQAS